MAKSKKPRLGRGLSSLMGPGIQVPVEPRVTENPSELPATTGARDSHTFAGDRVNTGDEVPSARRGDPSPEASDQQVVWLDVEQIEPNPHQPRKQFDKAAIETLAQSIRSEGLMQPIIVRTVPRETSNTPGNPVTPGGGGDLHADGIAYQLVAGERRLRAAKLAELSRIPAIVRELTDQQLAEWALIENLQREDLDPIERAHALANLAGRFDLTHAQLAGRIGMDRSTVSNLIRLIDLESQIQQWVQQKRLTLGHARALLGVDPGELRLKLAEAAIAQQWSVREIEKRIKRLYHTDKIDITSDSPRHAQRSAHLEDLSQQISEQLGTRVIVKSGRGKGTGTLQIQFTSLDQFDDLLNRLGVNVD